MKYKPTETELLEMGFILDKYWILTQGGYIAIKYFPKTCEFTALGDSFYPQSKQDLKALIKLFKN